MELVRGARGRGAPRPAGAEAQVARVEVIVLHARHSVTEVQHAVGLLNVNAVCLQFPKTTGAPCTEVSSSPDEDKAKPGVPGGQGLLPHLRHHVPPLRV